MFLGYVVAEQNEIDSLLASKTVALSNENDALLVASKDDTVSTATTLELDQGFTDEEGDEGDDGDAYASSSNEDEMGDYYYPDGHRNEEIPIDVFHILENDSPQVTREMKEDKAAKGGSAKAAAAKTTAAKGNKGPKGRTRQLKGVKGGSAKAAAAKTTAAKGNKGPKGRIRQLKGVTGGSAKAAAAKTTAAKGNKGPKGRIRQLKGVKG